MRLIALLLAACSLPIAYSHTYMISPKPRIAYDASNQALAGVTKIPYVNSRFPSFDSIGWCGPVVAGRTAGPVPADALVTTPLPKNLPSTYQVTSNNQYRAGEGITVFWAHSLVHPDPNVGTAALPRFTYGIRVAINYSATDMMVLNEPQLGETVTSQDGVKDGHLEQGWGYDPQAVNNLNWLPNKTFVLPSSKTCTNCVLQFWLESQTDGGGYIDCADISIAASDIGVITTTAPTASPPPTGGDGNGNGAPTTPAGDGIPTNPPTGISISPAELATHNTPADCWVSINTVVYDISSIVNKHPGGDAIVLSCGYETDVVFNRNHQQPAAVIAKLQTYKQGVLGTDSPPTNNPTKLGNDATQMEVSFVVMMATLVALVMI